MLKQKLQELFNKNKGMIRCSTLRRSNIITFKVTDDGKGFVCNKGSAVYLFDTMDGLAHEIEIMAKYSKDGKVYYGANRARNGIKLGSDPAFENTLDGIINRRCFSKDDGDSVFAASSFIAALLQKVGYAVMHSTDGEDAYITLTGRF